MALCKQVAILGLQAGNHSTLWFSVAEMEFLVASHAEAKLKHPDFDKVHTYLSWTVTDILILKIEFQICQVQAEIGTNFHHELYCWQSKIESQWWEELSDLIAQQFCHCATKDHTTREYPVRSLSAFSCTAMHLPSYWLYASKFRVKYACSSIP